MLGDDATLDFIGSFLPLGGIQSPSILQTLHYALALRGPLSVACDIANMVPEHQWLLSYPISSMPTCYKGIQTAVLKILSLMNLPPLTCVFL